MIQTICQKMKIILTLGNTSLKKFVHLILNTYSIWVLIIHLLCRQKQFESCNSFFATPLNKILH